MIYSARQNVSWWDWIKRIKLTRPISGVSAPTRLQILVWGGVMILAVGLSFVNYNSIQVGVWQDDANYLILAESLIAGGQYGLIHFPQPGGANFPFGYPLMLAPLLWLFDGSITVARLFSLAATLFNAELLFWGWPWFSRRSRWWAVMVIALYISAPFVVVLTRSAMSEPIFTTLTLLAILFTEQIARRDKPSLWWRFGLSLTLLLAVATRTIGVTLVFAVFAYLLLALGKRFWKEPLLIVSQMALIMGLIVLATPVSLQNIVPARYFQGSNASFVQGVSAGLADDAPLSENLSEAYILPEEETGDEAGLNFKKLFYDYFIDGGSQHLGEDLRLAVFPFGGGRTEQLLADHIGLTNLPLLVGFTLSVVIIIGFGRWVWGEGLSAFLLFPIFYSGLLAVWVWNGSRLLYPIVPQLFFGLLLGAEALAVLAVRLFRKPNWRPAVVKAAVGAVLVVVLGGALYKSIIIGDTRLHVGDLTVRTEWVKANIPASAVVMSEYPHLDYIYSDHQAVPMPQAPSTDQLTAYLAEQNVDVIIVGPEILWQYRYSPSYSKETELFLATLEKMALQDQVRLIHSAAADWVQVFTVQ